MQKLQAKVAKAEKAELEPYAMSTVFKISGSQPLVHCSCLTVQGSQEVGKASEEPQKHFTDLMSIPRVRGRPSMAPALPARHPHPAPPASQAGLSS